MKFWVDKHGHAIDAGIDHATAAMTRIMPRAVVERISNDTAPDGLAMTVRDWMHVRGWMRVGIDGGIMSVVQPYAATQFHLTNAQCRWIDDKRDEDKSVTVEFNRQDIIAARVANPSVVVRKMVSDGTAHWS